ncbi:hypothetical protein EL17_23585 [Anditalea andensis]|uniref:Uncharacterized protein n=1 Tax=Anditalea andensis TaxID=1048983 RepID=A0A074KRZ0_9BACT|nr:hypothetical protein EL17_23585 [Anditalea andensis]
MGIRYVIIPGILQEGTGYLSIYPDDEVVVAFRGNSGKGISFDIQNIGELFYKKQIVGIRTR